jgi:hypothetical protein
LDGLPLTVRQTRHKENLVGVEHAGRDLDEDDPDRHASFGGLDRDLRARPVDALGARVEGDLDIGTP